MTGDDLARLAQLADSADARAKWGRGTATTPTMDSEGTSRLLELIAAELRTLAQQQGDKPFPAPGLWFPLDILGNPMREFAPGKWETAQWPSDQQGKTGDHIEDKLVMVPAHSPDAGNMVDVLRIPRHASLDPIIVYFEDSAPGRGRITIACYGDAWTGGWGAMGNRTVRQFVYGVDPDYLAGSLLELRKASDHFRKYTERVAAAVIAAIVQQPESRTTGETNL